MKSSYFNISSSKEKDTGDFVVNEKNWKTCDFKKEFMPRWEKQMNNIKMRWNLKFPDLKKEWEKMESQGEISSSDRFLFINRWQKKLSELESQFRIFLLRELSNSPIIETLKENINDLKSDLKILKINGEPKASDRMLVNRYLNRYFREYNESRGYKKSARLVNDFFSPFLEYDPGILHTKQRFSKKIIDAYTQVVPVGSLEAESYYHKMMYDILEQSSKKSFIGIENHSNFMGPNVIATELHKYYQLFKKDGSNSHLVLPKFYFSVSGALTTQSNIKVGQSFATIVQTIANTDNTKDIILPKWALFEIRSNYKRKVEELLSVPGNFVWVAPTARRDVVERHNNGTASRIFFGDDTVPNVCSFLGILKKILENNNDIITLLISLNGTNQKDPLGINFLQTEKIFPQKEIAYVIGNPNEKTNERCEGNTYLSLKSYTSQEMIALIQQKKVMSTLADGLEDKYGNKIGYAVNAQTLSQIENQIKEKTEQQKFFFFTEELPSYKDDFQDTFYRKTIRKIFEAGKDYKKFDIKLHLLHLLKSFGRSP